MKQFVFFIFLLLSLSCKQESAQKSNVTTHVSSPEKKTLIKYADGFQIENHDGYKLLSITKPYPKAQKTYTYLLVSDKTKLPKKHAAAAVIEIPIQKAIPTSTTHIPAIELLNELESIIGFPHLDYISSEKTRALIKKGNIKEIGHNNQLNTEITLALQPDVIIASAMNAGNKSYNTLQKNNIPILYNGEWLETTPLGKAEWIKVFGALYQKDSLAQTIFNTIEKNYQDAKQLATTSKNKPSVLSGNLYKDVWYCPAGNSWQALFFKDANANYIYADKISEASLALSIEEILASGKNADFWVLPGDFSSYSQLSDASKHYKQLKAFTNKNVFSISLTKGETGGFLYYELGPSRPDLVLKDFIKIFHPELLPNTPFSFFQPLKK